MEILYILLIVFVLTLIAFGISYLISKNHTEYVFIMPSVYTGVTILLMIGSYSIDGWAALGYMIIAILFLVASIGSWITSIVLYIVNKNQ